MPADPDPLPRLRPVREALRELAEHDAVARLHRRDATLWSDDPATQEAITQRLGWLDAAAGSPKWASEAETFAAGARADGLHRVVLAGMGGSSLAPEVFAAMFAARSDRVQLQVLDSTHPRAVTALLGTPGAAGTLVLVSSKSGTTTETDAFAAHAEELFPPEQIAAITDPGSPLEERARAAGWRAVFTNPPDIGGRYSALSLFGVMPAVLCGIDIPRVWERGRSMLQRCAAVEPLDANPGALLAAFMAGMARAGRDKLTLLTTPELGPLGDWIEQLVAESTGKEGVGVVPVVGEPVGSPESYGTDRAFVLARLGGAGPADADRLAEAGHPVLTLDLDTPDDLGGEFVRWEVATALAGALLGVNPFDEPNVAESKANTTAVLDAVAAGEPLPPPAGDDVASLTAGLGPGDYLAVQAYVDPAAGYPPALARLRTVVRDRWKVATTAAWGPRYLHSTGQLHKGGPGSVVALQLVDAALWDPGAAGPPVPGRPYDFGTLLRAQAVGDLRSLRERGRRVAQVGVRSPDEVLQLARTLSSPV